MPLRKFLFTEQLPGKYYRHIAFWFCTYVPFLVMGIIGLYSKYSAQGLDYFISTLVARFGNLLIDMAYTYLIVYSLIPKYRGTGKLARFIFSIAGLTAVAFIIKGYFWFTDVNLFHHYPGKFVLGGWYLLVNFFNDGCIMRCVFFLICKMLKDYYRKTDEKINILRENATAELQLLKAQVHPHFLFNTLNNIYSFSLQRSPLAASLVLKLSDTLRYMITECEAPLVQLEKELKMLRDYIGLESVRYGSRLEVKLSVNGSPENKTIAPLLLIPLVENSFKHGTSQMLDKPWINLDITILDDVMEFRLVNSKPLNTGHQEGRNGIGLKNVQKRIELLYPSQHTFVVKDTPGVYEVLLKVPVHSRTIAPVTRSEAGNFGKLKLA